MDTSSWSENEKEWFFEYWGAFLDPDEWELNGFSLSEANEWTEWDVEPGVAGLYRKKGILNPPNIRFSYFGCDIEEAIDWEREGFDLATAFEWSEWEVDPETAVKYRNQGILEPPSEHFRDEGISLEDAFNWVNIGLDDFDKALLWIEWGVSPQDAKKYLDNGIEPPDEEFRESGISLTEAIDWVKLGFKSSEWPERIAEDEHYWKYWHDVGIKPEQANELREQLVGFLASEDQIDLSVRDGAMYSYQSYYGSKKKTDLEVLTSECLASLTCLKKLGMPINAENMYKWRGLTSEMILAAIDNSIEPDIAFALGKNLATPQGLEIHSLLKSMGVEHHIDWVQRWNFTIADIQALKKLKIDLHQFVMIAILERIDGRVLLDWAKAKWPIMEEVIDMKAKTINHVVSKWIKSGLEPKVAYPYFVDGFSPDNAKAWIDSGVKDPKIAKRRQDAGLHPK
jgi:hypothetical protein